MRSEIVRHLKPEHEPVAIVWSDQIPDDAVQPRQGRWVCILNLFAEAAQRGRISGGDRSSITCPGGRAALGLGADLIDDESQLDHFAALFSKGLESARDREAYSARIAAARTGWRPLLQHGERRHCSFEMARRWLTRELPRAEVTKRYVLFKPLCMTTPDDDVKVVVFLVNPLELAGLVTLVGSVVEGSDPVQVPQGADCFRIASFAYAQLDAESPRAVLGMLDVDGREVMQRRFGAATLTLALPEPLHRRVEQEAASSILQTPAWMRLQSAH